MQSESTVATVARWIALGALFLIPFTPLVVASSFFFPFITGKAFFFRILVEIAFFAWALLALLDKQYRPRVSLLGIVATAFVVWMCIADALALNATKAFWSNFERMEGWVLLIHVLGFFFVASAVLRATKRWRAWFYTSMVAALWLCGHAFLQLAGSLPIHQGSSRIDASFGNSAYFAVYLLFTAFIALWLASTEKRVWLARGLVGFSVVTGTLIFFTETRGTILGLVGALGLGALLTLLTAGKRERQWATTGLFVLLVLVGSFYLARNTAFVQENHMLERVASISLEDGSTRFTIWGMALEGVKERPLTGWGQEGFNYVFNKYYEPSLYAQEQWFDRAHNTFVDWLVAGGVPAFVLYISLFGFAITLLWRSSELSRGERIALTAVIAGYACHNFFVFDNLYSYVYFFAILAFIDSQIARPVPTLEDLPELSPQEATVYIPVVLIIGVFCVWTVNITGMQTSTRLITALSGREGLEKSIVIFEAFAKNPPFAVQEVREQLVSFATGALRSSAVSDADKQRIVSLAVHEMQKHVARYPLDAREHIQLAYIYRSAGASQSALDEVNKAIELSPRKEGFWIEKGSAEWDMGKMEEARASFARAYELGPQFASLATYAAAGAIAMGDTVEGADMLRKAFGTTEVDSDVLVAAYYRVGAWQELITLLRARVAKGGASSKDWFALASAYYASGAFGEAIATIRQAIVLHPEMQKEGEAAILEIEAKRNGQ